jgi:hypothetical protein
MLRLFSAKLLQVRRILAGVVLVCISQAGLGQIVIGTGTAISTAATTVIVTSSGITNNSRFADLSNVYLGLANPGSTNLPVLTTTFPLTLHGLAIAGKGGFQLTGTWTVNNELRLLGGNIVVPSATGNIFTYAGTKDIVTGTASSYINGQMFSLGTGVRTFPIGNNTGYFPVVLGGVKDATTSLGMQVVTGSPGLAPLPTGVTDLFTDHYWQLSVSGGTFSGSSLQLSTTGTDAFLANGVLSTLVVLEEDTDNNITNLGGSFISPVINVSKPISAKGKVYAIGKSEDVVVAVTKVITPTADDARNNVLQISNIELYPDNTVTLLDRYGVPVKSWKGFRNYSSTTPAQDDIDFSSLGIGNYICVVEYTTQAGDKKKVSQMVTVLK